MNNEKLSQEEQDFWNQLSSNEDESTDSLEDLSFLNDMISDINKSGLLLYMHGIIWDGYTEPKHSIAMLKTYLKLNDDECKKYQKIFDGKIVPYFGKNIRVNNKKLKRPEIAAIVTDYIDNSDNIYERLYK